MDIHLHLYIHTHIAEKQYRQLGGPLGVVPDKGVILPSKFTTGREPFGQKSASSLEPAKALIFPTDIHDTDEGIDDL